MTKTNKYDCGFCANKRTPLCDACSVIRAPDGEVSKPKYFVRLSDKPIHIVGYGGSGDIFEEISVYIKESAEERLPIPVALIMRYNKLAEQREAGDDLCQE